MSDLDLVKEDVEKYIKEIFTNTYDRVKDKRTEPLFSLESVIQFAAMYKYERANGETKSNEPALNIDLVIKSDAATKYAELREKCEEVVYGDPDGENDHTEMIAEIVCEEFEIM